MDSICGGSVTDALACSPSNSSEGQIDDVDRDFNNNKSGNNSSNNNRTFVKEDASSDAFNKDVFANNETFDYNTPSYEHKQLKAISNTNDTSCTDITSPTTSRHSHQEAKEPFTNESLDRSNDNSSFSNKYKEEHKTPKHTFAASKHINEAYSCKLHMISEAYTHYMRGLSKALKELKNLKDKNLNILLKVSYK